MPDAPRPRRPRVEWVDTGRGIAISLVVLFHSSNWLLGAGAHVRPWVEANVVVSSLRMPLFFTLAGLFAGKWVRGAWTALWHSKIRLYLWVFLVWGAVGSLAYYVGVRMRGTGSFLSNVLQPYVLSPFVPRLELWFIWALALFFVVAKLTRRVPVAVQIGVAAVGSAIALSGWETASPGWNGSVKYYVFFLVGLHLRDVVLRRGSEARVLPMVGVVALWAAVAFGLWAADLREAPGLYFVNCVLGVAAGIAVSRALSRSHVLRDLGARTLPVYLAHTPLIIVTAALLKSWGAVDSPAVAVLGPPLLAAAAIVATLALERGAKRVGAGWLYEPPAWFDVAARRRAARASRAATRPGG